MSWTAILGILAGLFGDVIRALIAKSGTDRASFAKSLRPAYEEHQKGWEKAKTTGDTSDLERVD